MAAGLSNAELAGLLFVGAETVKTHVGNILAKLGARNRTQAVIAAYESGFVSPDAHPDPGAAAIGKPGADPNVGSAEDPNVGSGVDSGSGPRG